jgi:general secretion pathway protein B
MSYVLEALRRAEADRHRGQVPDLHAPSATPLAGGPASAARAPGLAWRWIGAGLLLTLVAAAAGWWALQAVSREPTAGSLPVVRPTQTPATDDRSGNRPGDRPWLVDPRPVPPPVALPAAEPARRAAIRPAPSASETQAGSASRGDLPALVFGGAFDSPDPRARMLIINGQVWREGDEPVPGLVLVRIALHAAQFRYQGRAVELTYDGPPRAVSRP